MKALMALAALASFALGGIGYVWTGNTVQFATAVIGFVGGCILAGIAAILARLDHRAPAAAPEQPIERDHLGRREPSI